MAKHMYQVLGTVSSQAAGTAANVENLDPVCVNIFGTFVGTYTVEGSVDGTNFEALLDYFGNSLAGKTAALWAQLPAGLKAVRINCTAYTSGDIEGAVGGIDKTLKS